MPAERPWRLALLRGEIDAVDAGMRRLLALRRRLVAGAARAKHDAGLPERDPERERAMDARATRDGDALGLPPRSASALLALALDASRPGCAADAASGRDRYAARPVTGPRWVLRRAVGGALARALAAPLAAGAFDALAGRTLAVEVLGLGLRLAYRIEPGRLVALGPGATGEATVRGRLPDLLALAARSEDADALFFQRRLQLEGDVELGLTLRNLLDRLDWGAVPLAARIALARAARLAARLERRGPG